VIPTASFRRASQPDPEKVAAFVRLDDAPPEQSPVVLVPDAPSKLLSLVEDTDSVAEEAPAVVPKEPTSARQAVRKWRRKTLQRADGRELRKQTFYLDAELSHRLMVACAAQQYELSEAIEEAVNLWLKKKG
jgi:hypothetical protein